MLPGEQLPVATDDIGGVHHQRMKVGYGADGVYTDATAGTGLPIVPGYAELTGTAAALNADAIASTDVRQYRWASIQAAGSWSGTLRVQGSNDAITWYDLLMYGIGAGNTALGTALSALVDPSLYVVNLPARYLRVRMTTYTSGTATVTMALSATPLHYPPDIDSGGQAVNTELPDADPLADDTANPTAPTVGSAGMVFDGTTWDRARSATVLDNTAGTGLPGAGLIGWDGSVYRRVRVDASGYLQTEPVPVASVVSGKTSVTTAGTRVQLPSNAAAGVIVKASRNNASTIYIGNVTVASTNGFELDPGDVATARLSNTNLLYIDALASGDYVTWWVVA
jgi:hypothetical protein